MSFTYNFNTNLPLSQVRLLIMDTDSSQPIFDDDEITQFLQMKSSQSLYQSPQAVATGISVPAPVQVYSIYGAAALALMSMASNKAYLSSITKLLDVSLDPSKSQAALKAMAQSYLDMDDNLGHFAIAEMVQDQFSARERVYKQFLRLYGS
jgi:hypothetical protein